MSSGNSVVGESEWKGKGGHNMFSHDFVPLCFCKAKNDPNGGQVHQIEFLVFS